MKNLKAEMARTGVSKEDIMNLLGCSLRTVDNKLDEITDFTFAIVFILFYFLRKLLIINSATPTKTTKAEPQVIILVISFVLALILCSWSEAITITSLCCSWVM